MITKFTNLILSMLFHCNYSWKFPSQNTCTMWRLWFFGDCQRNICSFQHITGKYDLTAKACKNNLSRTAKVMKKLIGIAVADNIVSSKDVTSANSDEVFNHAYGVLLREIYGDNKKRSEEINVNTIGNLIK